MDTETKPEELLPEGTRLIKTVTSSNGKTKYKIFQTAIGTYGCTCKGFSMKAKCLHHAYYCLELMEKKEAITGPRIPRSVDSITLDDFREHLEHMGYELRIVPIPCPPFDPHAKLKLRRKEYGDLEGNLTATVPPNGQDPIDF